MARPRGQRRSGRRSLAHSEPLSGLCHRHGDHHGVHRVDHQGDYHFDHNDYTDDDDGSGGDVPLFAKK